MARPGPQANTLWLYHIPTKAQEGVPEDGDDVFPRTMVLKLLTGYTSTGLAKAKTSCREKGD